jgi:hypothetical protein
VRRAALAAAALAVVAGCCGALAASGAGPRTLTVRGSVDSLSASGTRVAVATDVADGGCGHALVWDEARGTVSSLKDPCSSDYVLQDLTLAGKTALWWDFSTGNHVYCDDVYATSPTRPSGAGLGVCDGTMGDTYYRFAGDQTIAAIADYTVCEADCTGANGDLLPDGNYGVEVSRIAGGKLVSVLKPVDFRSFLDAREWRVAVVEPKAVLTVYDTGGKPLWTHAGMTGVTGGWISGGSVVVRRGRSAQLVSARSTEPVRTLPPNADVESVVGGLVLYDVKSSVRLLRLADGRDRQLVSVKGLAGAQLTQAGLFYAAGGTVAFVPIRDVLAALH